MRNTSETIKENSHVMNAQGGEKKVMKKILSVALSTAMAFSMFASVAFGDTATSPQQQFDALKAKGIFNGYPDGTAGLNKEMTRAEFAKVITKLLGLKEITGVYSYTDKNYNAKNWAAPYIEAVTAAGIMEGKNTEKKIFDFNGKVTIEEMATILTRALDLEVPTETNNTASAWAKGYVQAAINAGLLDSSLNFQSNASRELLVGAAYAVDQEQSLKVASYDVTEAGKVVTFKMSDGESVKVTLDKALEANKETEVKFTYKDKEFTEKVTYVTTVAQAVQSVKADNLKQIVVTFNGTVEEATATEASNYTIDGKTIDSASLSDDKTTVTLTLATSDTNVLVNQKSTDLNISNVKNADGTKTFTQKVNFTPVDVTTPTIKEVTALGTKAIKVKFSEPVKQGQAVISGNYRIDGNVVAASVQYAYPDTVILVTNLTEGEHTLTVSNVEDFSGLKVVPVENKLTAAVDTAAPEITSIVSSDLKKVTVTFNETIKGVTKAYANSSSNSATVSISDNKVTLTFANPLNYSENTINLTGVRDYSDNSADRSGTVTPTLDTTRPTVISSEFKQDTNKHFIVKLKFSESLDSTSATTRANYVLKNSSGNVPSLTGVNSSGYPVAPITYDETTKTVTVDLGTGLGDSAYTLTVAGVKDTAYIGNTMLPFSVALSGADVQYGEISRSWINSGYLYVEYNTPVATSGAGSALDPAKYTVSATGATYKAITTSASDVDLVTSNTVRIAIPTAVKDEVVTGTKLNVSYVANSNGDYLTTTSNGTASYVLSSTIGNQAVKLNSAKAVSTTSVELDFSAAISSVNLSDFTITGSKATNYSLSSDRKTLTLTVDKLPANTTGTFITLAAGSTQDSYGNQVKFDQTALVDNIKPEIDTDSVKVTATDATYATLTLTANENIEITDRASEAALKDLFTIVVGGTEVSNGDFEVSVVENNKLQIRINKPVSETTLVSVSFNGSDNASLKAIADVSGNLNGLKAFDVADTIKNLK
ncbi:S-layer homology domain-containing protein [Paenibacillus pabuli]|uniref:S-layer homology domain-containing protein n=1 Tax=Paenibacillus pabuli TaxID=1472 RepID=UPI003458C75F